MNLESKTKAPEEVILMKIVDSYKIMFLTLQNIDWTPRHEQVVMVEKFKELINGDKKFYVVEAPTGVGKSFAIMLMIMEYLKLNQQGKANILTNTLLLQEQYLRDFKFIKSFKGKGNYICSQWMDTNCAEGNVLNQANSIRCMDCPFQRAKQDFKDSQIGLLNFALFINYNIYQPDFLEERKANILFIDEAYLFEEIYCDFIESHISPEYLRGLGVILQPRDEQEYNQIHDKHSYASFLTRIVMPQISLFLNKTEQKIKTTSDVAKKLEMAKEYSYVDRVKCKYNRFLSRVEINNWILETKMEPEVGKVHSIKSIWGTPFLKEIWDQYDKVVLLSGTVLDIKFFNRLLSIPKEESIYLNLDTPFPAKNRKITYLNRGRMSYDNIEVTYQKILPDIRTILEYFKDKKGIIHCGSYKLAQWLKNDLKGDRLLFHDNRNKESVLQYHTETDRPTVLVSPVMVNGVDLKDDLSRFQIIIKIPYPSLDSMKTKKRISQSEEWYSWRTLCSVIQSYGRSVRNESDYAETFILDGSFSTLMKKINLPEYFADALIVKSSKVI